MTRAGFSIVRLSLAAAGAIAAFLLPAAASSIVVRHDVADAAYLARESEFPALFGIYRTKQGFQECVATLIAPRWALTAAHCARDKKLIAAAQPGSAGHPVEIGGQERRIDRVVYHPGVGSGRAPDIALLRLSAPVTHIVPIPVHRRSDELGRVVLMPGWGGTGNGKDGLGLEDGLFRAAENVVDRAEGHRLWWRFDAPGAGSRALALEGISGPGDSGGPALVRSGDGWSLVGISSAQDTKDGAEGLYGVDEIFVRTSAVAPWIDRTVAAAR